MGQANESSLKTIHKTIKKVTEDMERFSFNTSVSSFMICVNELTDAKCTNKEILQSLAIILSPYAPHIAEEAWQLLGNNQSIAHAQWPKYDESFLVENVFEYPVSINGKMKFKCPMPASYTSAQVTDEISKHPKLALLLQGVTPKKIIVVPGKIINVVV
jgi:leucyl-tRNA synthetase